MKSEASEYGKRLAVIVDPGNFSVKSDKGAVPAHHLTDEAPPTKCGNTFNSADEALLPVAPNAIVTEGRARGLACESMATRFSPPKYCVDPPDNDPPAPPDPLPNAFWTADDKASVDSPPARTAMFDLAYAC